MDEEAPDIDFAFDAFYYDYQSTGRDRELLIYFIEQHPEYIEALKEYILEHLRNPTKRYLGGKQDYERESKHRDIYHIFMAGNEFFEEPIEGWLDLSYDQKIAEISKRYPDLSITHIGKIISDQKKLHPERPLTI